MTISSLSPDTVRSDRRPGGLLSPDALRSDRRAGALLSPRRRGGRPVRSRIPAITAFRADGRLVVVPIAERLR